MVDEVVTRAIGECSTCVICKKVVARTNTDQELDECLSCDKGGRRQKFVELVDEVGVDEARRRMQEIVAEIMATVKVGDSGPDETVYTRALVG